MASRGFTDETPDLLLGLRFHLAARRIPGRRRSLAFGLAVPFIEEAATLGFMFQVPVLANVIGACNALGLWFGGMQVM